MGEEGENGEDISIGSANHQTQVVRHRIKIAEGDQCHSAWKPRGLANNIRTRNAAT